MVGSVPEPNSSIRTSVRGDASASMARMFIRCDEYVDRSLSIDCWSPMSIISESNTGNSEFSSVGTRKPHCTIY